MAKVYNITTVGTLTNNDGVISGFNMNNFAVIPTPDYQTASTWEICLKVKYTGWSNENPILGSAASYSILTISINQGTGGMYPSVGLGNNSSWLGVINGTTVLSQNTDYWIKVTFDGSKYELFTSTNGITFTKCGEFVSSTKIYYTSGANTNLGVYRDNTWSSTAYWVGSIDLNESYIKIDGSYFWKGVTHSDGTKIQLRHDTSTNWTSVNPILLEGEIGIETDTKKQKIGDGSTAWNSLGYDLGSTALQSISSSDIQNAITAGDGISFTTVGQVTLDPYSLTAADTWTAYSGTKIEGTGSSGQFGYYPHFRLCEGINLYSDDWSITFPMGYKANGNTGFGLGYSCATSAWNSNIGNVLFNIYDRSATTVVFTIGNDTATRYTLNTTSGYSTITVKLIHETVGNAYKFYAKDAVAEDYTLLGTIDYGLTDNASLYAGVTGIGRTNPNGRLTAILSQITILSPITDKTQISVDSTIQRSLGYTPVNKAGDTMSGALTVSGDMTSTGQYYKKYPSTVSKGTNPSSDANSIYAIIDGNSSHTTWQSNRLGGVTHTLSTTGESSTMLMAYKNATNSTVNAQIKVGIYADGTTYCIFPNTTCVDGQWVAVEQQISTSTAIGTYNIDISSYLPNDSYKYEVMLNAEVYNSNSTYGHVYLSSSESTKQYVACVGTNARETCFSSLLTVGTDRQITLQITTHDIVWNNHDSRQGLYLVGYRRIGTNS